MTELKEETVFRITMGTNLPDTRKGFNEYIKKYYPNLIETVKEMWKKRFLTVNGMKEVQATGKLVDFINEKRYG